MARVRFPILTVPDLRGRFPCGAGQPSDSSLTPVKLGESKSSQAVRIAQAAGTEQRPVAIPTYPPYCALKFMLVTEGTFPASGQGQSSGPGGYLGEIALFAFNQEFFIPDELLPCDGRLLSITENRNLYSLLGVTFGGDGRSTFALPDLRGRIPMGVKPSGLLGEIATKVSAGGGGSGDLVVSSPSCLGLQFFIAARS